MAAKKFFLFLYPVALFATLVYNNPLETKTENSTVKEFEPLSYEEADIKADSILKLMTLDEKIALVGGDKSFFIRAFEKFDLPEVYMTDATQGVHIRENFRDIDLSEYQLEKSTAFPCPILLSATWNPELSYKYAESIGEE